MLQQSATALSPDAARPARIRPGSRFGRLTVLHDTGRRKNSCIIWKCQCDCGATLEVDKRTLLRGSVKDCGCATVLKPGQKDITGQRFGKLTALYCTGRQDPNSGYIWHLKCDCGGEVDAPIHQLTVGYRKSCGCLSKPPRKDWIGKRFGRLVVGAYVSKRNGHHIWKCRCDCGNEVEVTQGNLQSGHTVSCGCRQAEVHKDNLKLIEGTSVLLLEKRSGKLNASNSSGHTGVYYVNRSGKWAAQITFKRKTYYLGTYTQKEDAIKARLRAEEVHQDFVEWYYQEYLPSAQQNPLTAEG